jgi:hypothetical protein
MNTAAESVDGPLELAGQTEDRIAHSERIKRHDLTDPRT